MVEHQSIISSHHQEMQKLRDLVSQAVEQMNSLFRHAEQEYKDKAQVLLNLIDDQTIQIKSNNVTLSDQRHSILSLHQSINDCLSLSAKKSDLHNLKKEVADHIAEKDLEQDREFENYQFLVKHSFESLKQDIANLRSDMDKKFKELDNKIESRFSLSLMDKEGILKEVRVYKKSMFIIDKKIENIYTLIERINKRGEVCPKQA